MGRGIEIPHQHSRREWPKRPHRRPSAWPTLRRLVPLSPPYVHLSLWRNTSLLAALISSGLRLTPHLLQDPDDLAKAKFPPRAYAKIAKASRTPRDAWPLCLEGISARKGGENTGQLVLGRPSRVDYPISVTVCNILTCTVLESER